MLKDVPGVLFSPATGWSRLRDHADAHPWSFVPVLLLFSLIPAICIYIGTAHVGWELFGSQDTHLLTNSSALTLAILVYVGFVFGVGVMGLITRWVLFRTPGRPTLARGMAFITFVSLPLMLGGIVGAFPYRLLIVGGAFVTTAWAIVLLFKGLPAFMHLKRTDETRFYAACIVAVGFLVVVSNAFIFQHMWRAAQTDASYIGSQEAEQGLE
ncbi:Protein of unknown function [Halopseudomonas xinjiangensis]|uniref:Yip1 domain-containing protein n=1 Tax=Halopseudomonas xinjiangensis TaxID=487184 RepID=A0A1H1UF95_9GAMM|nr:Yip1 family protein [Halopseudomonas xinjiangensis]SDS71182.1 Protein of unknown function [Halopseudomonas xinjiangensis]